MLATGRVACRGDRLMRLMLRLLSWAAALFIAGILL